MFCRTLFQGNSVATAKTPSVTTYPIIWLSFISIAYYRAQPRCQSVSTFPIIWLLATYAIYHSQSVTTYPIIWLFLMRNLCNLDSFAQVMNNFKETKKIIGQVVTQNRISGNNFSQKIGRAVTKNRAGGNTKPPQHRARIGFAVLFTKVVYTVLKYFIGRHFFRFIKWRLKPHTISINLAVKTAQKRKHAGGRHTPLRKEKGTTYDKPKTTI